MVQKKQMAVGAAPVPLRALEAVAPDLFDKCRKYTTAKEVMAAGLYPYFHVVESEQNPEVIVEGRKMIMLGSNNYLGLTSHPEGEGSRHRGREEVRQRLCGYSLPQWNPRHPCEARGEAGLVLSQGGGAHFFHGVSNQPRDHFISCRQARSWS